VKVGAGVGTTRAAKMPRKTDYTKILAVEWPDADKYPMTPAGEAEYAEEKQRYYTLTKKDNDPEDLADLGKDGWKVLWHRRDRAEDAARRARGDVTKIMELESANTIKKAKNKAKKEGKDPPTLYSLTTQMTTEDNDKNTKQTEVEDQEYALSLVKQLKFFQPPAPSTGTWPLKFELNITGKLASWFADKQSERTHNNHYIKLGDLWLTGYQGYQRSQATPDHNQRVVSTP
jgi:hypothetical protein